jgi:hypothetical protein
MADEKIVTVEEAKAELTAEEIAVGQSFGLIEKDTKADDKKAEEKSDDEKVQNPETDSAADGEKSEEAEKVEEADDSKPADEPAKKADSEDKAVEHSSDLDTEFDSMATDPEKEHETLKSYDKSQKAFYWKWKKSNRAKQDAIAQAEIQSVRIKALEEKLANQSSKKTDEVDDLIAEAEAKRPLTVAEYEAAEKAKIDKANRIQQIQETVRKRIFDSGQEYRSKHSDFGEVLELADAMMKEDKSGNYYQMFFAEAEKPDGDPAGFTYRLGKLHPKYKASTTTNNGQATKLVNQKKQTSAALSSALPPMARPLHAGENGAPRKNCACIRRRSATTPRWRGCSTPAANMPGACAAKSTCGRPTPSPSCSTARAPASGTPTRNTRRSSTTRASAT